MGTWSYESDASDHVMDYVQAKGAGPDSAIAEWVKDQPFFGQSTERDATYLGIVIHFLDKGIEIKGEVLKQAFKICKGLMADSEYLKKYSNHLQRAHTLQKELIRLRKEIATVCGE
jgi:hypothetical protein